MNRVQANYLLIVLSSHGGTGGGAGGRGGQRAEAMMQFPPWEGGSRSRLVSSETSQRAGQQRRGGVGPAAPPGIRVTNG